MDSSRYVPRRSDDPHNGVRRHEDDVPQRNYGDYGSNYSSTPTHRPWTKVNWAVAKKIVTGQRVEVRIDGHGWVIGLVLGCLKFYEIISGEGFEVRYSILPDRRDRTEVFRETDVRPAK